MTPDDKTKSLSPRTFPFYSLTTSNSFSCPWTNSLTDYCSVTTGPDAQPATLSCLLLLTYTHPYNGALTHSRIVDSSENIKHWIINVTQKIFQHIWRLEGVRKLDKAIAFRLKINISEHYQTTSPNLFCLPQRAWNKRDIENHVSSLASNNHLNELLCSVIICLFFELINLCLPFFSKPFKNFLVPAITYKSHIIN